MYTLRYGPQLAHSVMLYYIRQTLLSSLEEGLGTRLVSTILFRKLIAKVLIGTYIRRVLVIIDGGYLYSRFYSITCNQIHITLL